ncbi:MAG: hypothetical protein QMC78_03910 [Methanocellales archaeon]|nr:hypothetical protein [Methanocellales archaeon]
MEQKFYDTLAKILATKKLSISGITRQLKKQGYDQHRLILTGYLRALRDIGHLVEEDIPPSKVYSYVGGKGKDIYTLVGERIPDIERNERFAVGVYVLSALFRRPCFEQELISIGLSPMDTEWTRKSRDPHLKEYRAMVKRINIPSDNPAYEFINKENNPILETGAEILAGVIREVVDLSGLYLRYQQLRLGVE